MAGRRGRPAGARIGLVAGALFAALVAAALAGGEDEASGASTRPNIILITTDDQTAASMPYMRRVEQLIGARGVTFDDSIASFPLCCPARATWITGQYAHNNGVLDNMERNGGGYESLRDPTKVLPVWLKAGGYETALAGKFLHDYRSLKPAPGWDRFNALVPPTVTRYYDYVITDSKGGTVTYGEQESDYLTDVLTRAYAIPFLYSRVSDSDPFFLHLSYTAPHWGKGRNDAGGGRCANGRPFTFDTARAKPAPRHAGRFRAEPLPENPAFNEENVRDKPKGVNRRPPLKPGEIKEITARYRCALAAGLAVDEGVKQIDNALNATGLAANTYVIFTSDNGYMNGEHRIRSEKVQPYEEAIKVPLMIRGPGVPAGVHVADPVANVDIAPTVLDMANLSQPLLFSRTPDGVSLLPYASGATAPRRAILIEAKRPPHGTSSGAVVAPSWVGVRTSRYVYVEHYSENAASLDAGFGLPIGVGGLVDSELYDLETDPHELRSRRADPAYAATRAALAATLAQLRACAGASCIALPAIPPPR